MYKNERRSDYMHTFVGLDPQDNFVTAELATGAELGLNQFRSLAAPFCLALGLATGLSGTAVPAESIFQQFIAESRVQTTGQYIIRELGVKDYGRPHVAEALLSVSERLTAIRAYLSLNVAELSRVLHVKRPTIYSWASDNVKSLKSQHRDRLAQIFALSKTWRSMTPYSVGEFVREPGPNGSTLVDLLVSSELDVTAIKSRFAELKKTVEAANARPQGVRSMLQRHQIASRSEEQGERSIGQMFG